MKIDSLENKMAVYDKENMLWRSMEQHPFDDTEMSLGQRIWDAISVHGSKVAQVFSNYFGKTIHSITIH